MESFIERRDRSKGKNKSGKRQFPQKDEDREGAKKQKNGAPAKRQNQPPTGQIYYGFCKKPGHLRRDCWRELGLCLLCGSSDHQMTECVLFKPRDLIPTLPSPPMQRNPGPVGRGAPLPLQNQAFIQNQRGAENGRGRGQVHLMAAETVGVSDNLAEGNDSTHSEVVCSGIRQDN